MKKLLGILLSLSLVLTFVPSLAFAEATTGEYDGKTVILYTGNLRGDIDVYPKLAKAKEDFKTKGADAVYLADAGNYLQGTTYANTDRGLSIYNLMDAAGYDVAAMGAYEFVYAEATTGQKWHGNLTKYHTQKMLYEGQENTEYAANGKGDVKNTLAAKAKANFEVISSNIKGKSSVKVDAASVSIGNPEQLYAFDGNAVMPKTGTAAIKVGFAALTDTAVPALLQDNYFAGLSYTDAPVIPDADVVIGLSNTGADVPETAYTIKAPTGGEEVIGAVAIDNNTKAVKELKFELGSFNEDEAVANKVKSVKEGADNVTATSGITFTGKNSLHRSQETTMGDLVTDSLLWYAKNKFEGFKKDVPVVAIQNGGNIRESLHTGHVLEKDLFHSYPYSPAGIGILYVTGEQLLESLEESTRLPAAFPHVAGMTYNVDTNEEYDASTTKGEKKDGKYGEYDLADSYNIISITSVDGKPFDPKATYAVVGDNMVVANGLDTYGSFKAIKGTAKDGEYLNNGSGVKVRDVVGKYLKENCKGIVPEKYADVQGRITFGDSSYKKAKAAMEAAKAGSPDKYLAAANALKKEADTTCNPDKIKEAETAVAAAEKAVKDAADKAAAEKAAKEAAEKAAKEAAEKEAKAKKVKAVTVNKAKVTAKVIDSAVTAAGGSSKYVTSFVLGKKVRKISKGAFKAYKKATVLQIKTKKLKKAGVKGCLKGSAVKTIKVNAGSKKVNKKFVKKYKKIFTKKNAGKKVKVK